MSVTCKRLSLLKVLVAGALFAVLCAPDTEADSALATAPGGNRAKPDLPYGPPITLGKAKSVAAVASAEARKNHWAVTIAVVDPSGELVYFEKMDDVLFGAIDTAIAKARSAARFKQSTKLLQEALGVGGEDLRVLGMVGAVPIDGGRPLVIAEKIVGAIGISGVAAAQDGEIAAAAAASLTTQD